MRASLARPPPRSGAGDAVRRLVKSCHDILRCGRGEVAASAPGSRRDGLTRSMPPAAASSTLFRAAGRELVQSCEGSSAKGTARSVRPHVPACEHRRVGAIHGVHGNAASAEAARHRERAGCLRARSGTRSLTRSPAASRSGSRTGAWSRRQRLRITRTAHGRPRRAGSAGDSPRVFSQPAHGLGGARVVSRDAAKAVRPTRRHAAAQAGEACPPRSRRGFVDTVPRRLPNRAPRKSPARRASNARPGRPRAASARPGSRRSAARGCTAHEFADRRAVADHAGRCAAPRRGARRGRAGGSRPVICSSTITRESCAASATAQPSSLGAHPVETPRRAGAAAGFTTQAAAGLRIRGRLSARGAGDLRGRRNPRLAQPRAERLSPATRVSGSSSGVC
jgi:hypothetical protein